MSFTVIRPLSSNASVDHQQALQLVLVQQRLGIGQRRAVGHRDQPLARRHDVAHLHVVAGLEAQVPAGDDADHLAAVQHRKAGNAQLVGQLHDLQHGVFGGDDHRVAQHAGFIALDACHLGGLLFGGEVFVNDPDAAFLGDGNGQARLGHRVHGGGHERQVQADVSGELRRKGRVLGQDLGERRHQQHIVEGERFS
jgi:hypothetical protein